MVASARRQQAPSVLACQPRIYPGERGTCRRFLPLTLHHCLEADMSDALAKLQQFSLGLSADGRMCRMVFVDDHARSVECTANFDEFTKFVSQLCEAATEMAKRVAPTEAAESYAGIAVAAASFQPDPETGQIQGNLVTDSGDSFALQLAPMLAAHMARDLVMALPAGAAN
jgi:hypothetical protein